MTLFKVATSTIILHDNFTVHLRRKVKGRRKLGMELEGEAREPGTRGGGHQITKYSDVTLPLVSVKSVKNKAPGVP